MDGRAPGRAEDVRFFPSVRIEASGIALQLVQLFADRQGVWRSFLDALADSRGQSGNLIRKLVHGPGEAERFYRRFPGPALIGLESTGNCQWFVELLTALGHEVWIGDAARIRASDVRQQKHDRRDAALRCWRQRCFVQGE